MTGSKAFIDTVPIVTLPNKTLSTLNRLAYIPSLGKLYKYLLHCGQNTHP
jgi:hypothetical protein